MTTTSTRTTIGDQIHVARNLTGLTLAAVGKHLGVSAQAVHKWETGEAYPTHPHLQALSVLLGVQHANVAAPSTANPLLHELLMAEIIIVTMLNAMTTDQKLAIAGKLDALGVSGEGATRFHERRAAITAAGAA